MGNKKKKFNENYSLREIVSLIVVAILGLGSFVVGAFAKNIEGYEFISYVMSALGASLVIVGTITLLSVLVLRRSFISNVRDAVMSSMQEILPDNYKNLKSSGLYDSVQGLNKTGIIEKIGKAWNCEILILKMWISNVDELDYYLLKAIKERGCTVKVLLLSPEAEATIRTRAEAINFDSDFVINSINRNIEKFKGIWKQLSDEEKKRFQFKTHDSFVAVSLIGVSGEIVLGLYLRNKLSTQGTQFRLIGETTVNYTELKNHFVAEWEKASFYDLDDETNLLRMID